MAEQWARACCGSQDHLFHELHEDSETAGPGATTRNTNNQKLPILSWPWNTWKKPKETKLRFLSARGAGNRERKWLRTSVTSSQCLFPTPPSAFEQGLGKSPFQASESEAYPV